MQKRETRMQDGRCLIFYMFEDEPHRTEEKSGNNNAEEKLQVKPEATEERSV
jgi:hypothetical protein